MTRLIITALVALTLSACDETYENQEAVFVKYVKNHRMGHTMDYWLEKEMSTGGWAKVILVFGFGDDDGVACRMLIEQDKKAGNVAALRCIPAN
jgi:hypothetical protein